MAEEALSCFTSLLESVPGWIADLEDILKVVKEKQKEVVAESQPIDGVPVMLRKASKSSSLRSRMSRDENINVPPPHESEADLLQPELLQLTASDAQRLAQRKRKTASNCSARQSGPFKYRSRSMAIIYYDGDIQQRFESLVRAIGTCRNNLRKGKMSAKVDALTRSGSSGSEGGPEDGIIALTTTRKMAYRTTRVPRTEVFSRYDSGAAFDKADKFLEQAQTLCERAAHQVLRDGDCALEISNAKERFIDVQKLSDAEMPELKRRAEKAAERNRREEEGRVATDGTQNKHHDIISNGSSLPAKDTEPIALHESFGSPQSLEADIGIEADDSDEDDDPADDYSANAIRQLGLEKYQKFQMRTSRIAAVV